MEENERHFLWDECSLIGIDVKLTTTTEIEALFRLIHSNPVTIPEPSTINCITYYIKPFIKSITLI